MSSDVERNKVRTAVLNKWEENPHIKQSITSFSTNNGVSDAEILDRIDTVLSQSNATQKFTEVIRSIYPK